LSRCCASHNFACYMRKDFQMKNGMGFVFGVNKTQCRRKDKGFGGLYTKIHYVGPEWKKPRPHYYTCEENPDSAWLCPSWALPPPFPPVPPVAPIPLPPPPPPRPGWPDVLSAESCAEPFESCWGALPGEMFGPAFAPLLCCFPDEQGHPFTCMRRAPATAGGRARQYAMCRRANDDGSCMHVDGWECPRTPPPSPPPPDGTPLALVAGGSSHAILMPDGCHGNWQSCWENVGTMNARRGCCSASRGVAYGEIEPAGREFGCFRRVGRQFAMCKPLPRDVACASDDHWECPEAPPPSPVAAASDGGLTPPGLSNAADVACAGNYEACVLGIRPVLDRSCCLAGHDGKPFGCFKRVGRQFAMCRPLQLPCTSDETCARAASGHE